MPPCVGGTGDHAALVADPSITGLVRMGGASESVAREAELVKRLDVVFPLIHGGYGEDGKLQGLLEMADLAYVRIGLASARHWEWTKRSAKRLFRPRTSRRRFRARSAIRVASPHRSSGSSLRSQIEAQLGYPCFVKPACQGRPSGRRHARAGWEDVRAAIDGPLLR